MHICVHNIGMFCLINSVFSYCLDSLFLLIQIQFCNVLDYFVICYYVLFPFHWHCLVFDFFLFRNCITFFTLFKRFCFFIICTFIIAYITRVTIAFMFLFWTAFTSINLTFRSYNLFSFLKCFFPG